jgi:hypothetical protein
MHLQQLPKLTIRQDEYISVFFACFEHFLDDCYELFEAEAVEKFRGQMEQIKTSKPEMFKEFEGAITDFLKSQLDQVASKLRVERHAALSRLEESFQSFRNLSIYHPILREICNPPENSVDSGRSILIAGCGRCPEADWLLKTFQRSVLQFADISESELNVLREKLAAIHSDSAGGYTLHHTDLRLADKVAAISFDSFFFFHPLLLDFALYSRLLRAFAAEKDAKKRRDLLARAQMSDDARLIFDNILHSLSTGGTGVITVVDGFEAHAMYSYLEQTGLHFSVTCNPYALKKLGVILIAGMTPREAEQRTYHYIFRLKKTKN